MSSLAKRSTIVFYGIGAISPTIKNVLFGSFLFYYYNQVLGLEAYLISLALALSLVVDAVTDPLLGYISDHTSSRLGRRHPFIYSSLIPSPILYYLLLTLDFTSTQAGLFAQLFLLATFLRLSWTFFNVPRQAMGPELTKDYSQRNTLAGISTLFAWIGGAFITFVTNAVFLDESFDNLQGYHDLGLWGGLLIFITGTIFAFGTHREIPHLEPPLQKRPVNARAIWFEIKETLSHRSWLMLFIAGIVTALHTGVTTGLTIYFNRHLWLWKPSDIAIFALTSLAGAIIVAGFAGRLARRWDKKRMAVILVFILIFIGDIHYILRLSDLWIGTSLFPENGPQFGPLWWFLMVHALIKSCIFTMAVILIASMNADIVEDSQTTTGRRSEGLFFAGPHLVEKCITGFGYIVKGALLSAVGVSVGVAGAEMTEAIERLAAAVIVLGFVLPLISLYFLNKYEITRDTHESNLGDLGYSEDFPTRL